MLGEVHLISCGVGGGSKDKGLIRADSGEVNAAEVLLCGCSDGATVGRVSVELFRPIVDCRVRDDVHSGLEVRAGPSALSTSGQYISPVNTQENHDWR